MQSKLRLISRTISLHYATVIALLWISHRLSGLVSFSSLPLFDFPILRKPASYALHIITPLQLGFSMGLNISQQTLGNMEVDMSNDRNVSREKKSNTLHVLVPGKPQGDFNTGISSVLTFKGITLAGLQKKKGYNVT